MTRGPVSPLWLFALAIAIFIAFGFALYFVGDNGGTVG